MAEDDNLFVPRPDTPLMIVGADKAWMYIIAPRVGAEVYERHNVWNAHPLNEGEDGETHDDLEDDTEQETAKTFNPLTGEFE